MGLFNIRLTHMARYRGEWWRFGKNYWKRQWPENVWSWSSYGGPSPRIWFRLAGTRVPFPLWIWFPPAPHVSPSFYEYGFSQLHRCLLPPTNMVSPSWQTCPLTPMNMVSSSSTHVPSLLQIWFLPAPHVSPSPYEYGFTQLTHVVPSPSSSTDSALQMPSASITQPPSLTLTWLVIQHLARPPTWSWADGVESSPTTEYNLDNMSKSHTQVARWTEPYFLDLC